MRRSRQRRIMKRRRCSSSGSTNPRASGKRRIHAIRSWSTASRFRRRGSSLAPRCEKRSLVAEPTDTVKRRGKDSTYPEDCARRLPRRFQQGSNALTLLRRKTGGGGKTGEKQDWRRNIPSAMPNACSLTRACSDERCRRALSKYSEECARRLPRQLLSRRHCARSFSAVATCRGLVKAQPAGNVLSATPVRTSLEYLPAQLEAIVRPILAETGCTESACPWVVRPSKDVETGQLANLIKTNAKLDLSMTMTMPDKKTTVEAPEMDCGIPVYTNPNKLAHYTQLPAFEDLINF